MSHPYRASVERLAGGATFLIERGQPPAPTDPVIVLDGWQRRVAFTDDQIPAQVEPVQITGSLAALSADDLPPLNTGDLWRIIIEISDDGQEWTTYSDDMMRLDSPELTLHPQSRRPVRAALTFTDTLADLSSRFPQAEIHVGTEPAHWLDEWATRSVRDINVWYPVQWADPWNIFEMLPTVPATSAAEQLAKFAAGYPVGRNLWVLRPRYSHVPPDDEVWIGAGPKPPQDDPDWTPPTPDLTNPVGYVFQQLNRTAPASTVLPFVLADTPAGVGIAPSTTTPADSVGLALIPGEVVTVPTEARRARDTTPNTHVIGGFSMVIADGELEFEDSTTEMPASSLGPADARRTRSIETLNAFRVKDENNTEIGNAATAQRIEGLRQAYEPDLGPVTAEWSYDDLIVSTAGLSAAEYIALVPMLTIAGPEDDDSDHLPVRPVVVTDVDNAVDLTGRSTIAGTLTRATLTIAGGRIDLTIRLRPGTLPLAEGAGVTAADLAASPWPALTVADLDPDLTALDMRLVSADW